MNTLNITKNGVNFQVLVNPKNISVWNCIPRNMWEEHTFRIFDRFLSHDHSYIDFGAWVGPTVLYGAHRAKHVYGMEPDPVAYQELVANISLNPTIASKITCLNAALSEKPGHIKLYMRSEFGDSSSSLIPTLADTNYCIVKAMTILEFITENQIRDMNFIKMDIEGGEYFLIPHLQRFLELQKPTLYLSVHPKFLGEHIQLKQNDAPFLEPEAYTRTLLESLRSYKYIYDPSGNRVDEDAVYQIETNSEFLFTDECW
jgi:FkbM family methyltransferase